MDAERRGLPLLSGPPPSFDSDRRGADIACRKCNKEFMLFTRPRKCNHCGFNYCSSCTDYTALMPRTGDTNGWDPVPVCSFCIEHLNITAGGRNYLRGLPLAKLKRYVTAYNIKTPAALEKDDLVEAILKARGPNGCLPFAQEDFYRLHSVPNGRVGRPRGMFSTRPPPTPAQPSQQTGPTATAAFSRPDLEQASTTGPPRSPPQQPQTSGQNTPRSPPPPSQPSSQSAPSSTPHQSTSSGHNTSHYTYTPRAAATPPPFHSTRPRYASNPHPQPTTSYPPHFADPRRTSGGTPSRPATAAPAAPRQPPPPTPSLDELLAMSEDALGALSIGQLKAALFQNHVNARLLLEKSELVARVKTLVEDERQERAREAAAHEREEQEIIARQHAMMEEQRLREERAQAAAAQVPSEDDATAAGESKPATPPTEPAPSASPPPPPPRMSVAAAERTGLCVICQDEEANIAIVDCGHMAMCRSCSELIMSSSRECPLCRTRIVTEQRLLRIFKT